MTSTFQKIINKINVTLSMNKLMQKLNLNSLKYINISIGVSF